MFTINNEKLKTLLKKKGDLITEGRKITEEISKLEEERNKLGLKVQKLKDQIVPIVMDETKGKLAEFEEIENVELKDGEIEVRTYDAIEEYKKHYLANKNKQNDGLDKGN